ncbi:squalene/phytoene synthase family protein [Actinopolymorpha singaporensis]|uniref:Farnesyl-diphosphate farnesyltransferase n=1 Tax=Actinopolymorpha singaporensis TaxID=117157 RepID=A0A1H1TIV1_9ACTN|nr:squalene/phytoene synthase family protein [Actinopolymorpha singaporensis]SDS60114.1 farnesyl-diphosphate farnesyltransferase [Actinopolymorpha singaporensis]
MNDISNAYDICEEITRREARNFSYGIRLLPPPKRRALSAVYATARRIDDIGDGDLPAEEKLRRLAETRKAISHLGADEATRTDPVLLALADAAARFPIPLDAFDELVAGCEADSRGAQYDTFDDLVGYCQCVAGSVGRLSTGVYAPAALAHAMPLADTLGIALQITNILRDLREDRQIGRIYLPREDLRRFGCSLDLDAAGRLADPPERLAALVRFEADRAEIWYRRGLTLLPLLDRRAAACTAAMAGIYRRLLRQIARDPEAVRAARLSLGTRQKLAVAVRALVRRSA